MADISKITVNGTTYELKDAVARVKYNSEYTWLDEDPVIGEFEIAAATTGLDQTEGTFFPEYDRCIQIKLGNGRSRFSELPYIRGGEVNTVENHNGIYRGKQLCTLSEVSSFIEILHDKVSISDFSDLFLGDYFPLTITPTLPDETVETETVELMIGAFNYYYNVGDTALTKPHLVLIPRGAGFATPAKMNEANSTVGGYLNTYIHTTVLPCYAASLSTALNNHLLSHRSLLSNAVNASGVSSGWSWATVQLQLMNEPQICGTTVWSSSAFDVGADNRQLPVFKFINPIQFGRSPFWLRSVVSSTLFAFYSGDGATSNYGASNTLYVRPIILFG